MQVRHEFFLQRISKRKRNLRLSIGQCVLQDVKPRQTLVANNTLYRPMLQTLQLFVKKILFLYTCMYGMWDVTLGDSYV